MHRCALGIALFALVGLAAALTLGACSEPPPEPGGGGEAAPGPERPVRGKKVAPVEIRAPRVDELGAALEIEFGSEAVDVEVRTYGVDGLEVFGEEFRIRGGAYRRGDTVALDVGFAVGTAPGLLAVRVAGTFEGNSGVRVVTFSVGGPERAAHAPKANIIEADGQRLHVTPARER